MDNLSIDGITAVLMSAVENGWSFSINVHLPDDSLHTAVALAEQTLGGNSGDNWRKVTINTQDTGVIVLSTRRGKGEVDIYTQLSKQIDGSDPGWRDDASGD
jgi:hypothetical protein